MDFETVRIIIAFIGMVFIFITRQYFGQIIESKFLGFIKNEWLSEILSLAILWLLMIMFFRIVSGFGIFGLF